MRFWDSSALVPLCVEEPSSRIVRAFLRQDVMMVVWWGSPVECWSAFARRRREGGLTVKQEEAARTRLRILQEAWVEISPGDSLRAHAARLLRLHPLGSGDALQLAAALVWAGSPPSGEVVTLDRRLSEAARQEGLASLP